MTSNQSEGSTERLGQEVGRPLYPNTQIVLMEGDRMDLGEGDQPFLEQCVEQEGWVAESDRAPVGNVLE